MRNKTIAGIVYKENYTIEKGKQISACSGARTTVD
jgi:hypothetical protein